jgi:hypothetical protein
LAGGQTAFEKTIPPKTLYASAIATGLDNPAPFANLSPHL